MPLINNEVPCSENFWDYIPADRWANIVNLFKGVNSGANWSPAPSTTQWVDYLSDES